MSSTKKFHQNITFFPQGGKQIIKCKFSPQRVKGNINKSLYLSKTAVLKQFGKKTLSNTLKFLFSVQALLSIPLNEPTCTQPRLNFMVCVQVSTSQNWKLIFLAISLKLGISYILRKLVANNTYHHSFPHQHKSRSHSYKNYIAIFPWNNYCRHL